MPFKDKKAMLSYKNKWQKEHYHNNKAFKKKALAKVARWRAANPDKIKEYAKLHRLRNLEKIKKQQKAHRERRKAEMAVKLKAIEQLLVSMYETPKQITGNSQETKVQKTVRRLRRSR